MYIFILILVSSGVLVSGVVGRVHDDAEEETVAGENPRKQAEKIVKEASKEGVRGSIIRLAPYVYGNNGKGFITAQIDASKKEKASYYYGNFVVVFSISICNIFY